MLRRTISVSTHNGNDGNRYRISGRDNGTCEIYSYNLGYPTETSESTDVLPAPTLVQLRVGET
jgi:hypothetical protein